MKKKIVTIVIAAAVLLSCSFAVPSTMHANDCFAGAKAKYVKVKQATYDKMKKTIASQKKTIASQKKTITARDKTITTRNNTIASQKKTISNQNTTINDLNATIKDKKSTISWLWDQLEAFGYFYNYDSHKWEPSEETAEDPLPEPLEWTVMMECEDVIPLMAEQTGLVIDHVQVIETWKSWASYYVEADGDIYVITMKKGVVDVCAQLN